MLPADYRTRMQRAPVGEEEGQTRVMTTKQPVHILTQIKRRAFINYDGEPLPHFWERRKYQ
jgi:hypothetical protein